MPTVDNYFTPQRASELAKAGWKTRKAREDALLKAEADLIALRKALANAIPGLASGETAKKLEEQMSTILVEMEGADENKKQKLSSAYDKLFKVWQVLTGTANPGVRKSNRRPERQIVQPLDSAPEVQQPGKPLGWEYDSQ